MSHSHIVDVLERSLPCTVDSTTESVVIPALEAASGKRESKDFAVSFHPEFLREGTAVADFFEPPFTVFDTRDEAQAESLRDLYRWSNSRFFINYAEVRGDGEICLQRISRTES